MYVYTYIYIYIYIYTYNVRARAGFKNYAGRRAAPARPARARPLDHAGRRTRGHQTWAERIAARRSEVT